LTDETKGEGEMLDHQVEYREERKQEVEDEYFSDNLLMAQMRQAGIVYDT